MSRDSNLVPDLYSGKRSRSGRTIFYSLAAQSDNLGDVEIRKVVLEWLLDTGQNVAVYAGSMPQDYLDAFDLPPDVRVTSSSLRFQMQLFGSILRRRAHLVFAPGPQSFGSQKLSAVSRPRIRFIHLVKPTINLFNTIAIRISGGRAIGIGRALRGSGRVSRSLERIQIRALDLYCVRDTASSEAVGMKLRLVPDAAFMNVSRCDEDASKPSVVISLRGDRPANRNAVAGLVHAANEANMQPVFVTQVRSDESQHSQLASELSCRIVSWSDASHSDQLTIVKSEYAKAHLVVSDRLHALIFGAQHGATPVAIVHPSVDKLTSTLSHILPLEIVESHQDRWPNAEALIATSRRNITIHECAVLAQRDLADLRDEIVGLLSA